MKNQWFGQAPWAPMCEYLEQVPPPAGELCFHCGEPIAAEDDGYMIISEGGLRPLHAECHIRKIIGSVGHIQHKCHCFGGNEEDPPGLTKRQAAAAAVRLYYQLAEETLPPTTPTAVVEPPN